MRYLITMCALVAIAISVIGCGEKYPQEIKVGFSGTNGRNFRGAYANSESTYTLSATLPQDKTINLLSKKDSVWAWGKLTFDTTAPATSKLVITLKDKDGKLLDSDSVINNDTTTIVTVKYKK